MVGHSFGFDLQNRRGNGRHIQHLPDVLLIFQVGQKVDVKEDGESLTHSLEEQPTPVPNIQPSTILQSETTHMSPFQ